MEQQPTGRARGRARARARAPQQQQQGPAGRPGQPPTQQQRAPPGFGAAAQQRRPDQPPPGQPPAVGAAAPISGRASVRVGVRPEAGGGDDISGRMQHMQIGAAVGPGGDAQIGRGAMRGRRQISTDILRTRPVEMGSKQGKTGDIARLTANYFQLVTSTDWCLYQYRVDFAPEEDRTVVKKGLLRNHKETLGGYIFDGTLLFTSHRLHPDPMELFSKRASDDVMVKIDVRLVGDLAVGDYHYLQFFNILMRKCFGHLDLQLVGRNFFDAHAKVEIRNYKLELWPGYVTSIRQHENSILMCAEISHKVMRQDTVLELLSEIYHRNERDYQRLFIQEILGKVVLTDYNNRTYRIDDVDFRVTPASTFSMKGQDVSYSDYYRNKYQLRITQMDQPMLVSKPRARERRAGAPELIYLVPELCRLTGLTDEMRNNFSLMRELANYTRVAPDSRIEKLLQFNQRLNRTKEIQQDLRDWNLKLDANLVQFNGRVLPQEKIVQASNIKYDAGPQTDWTRDLRSNPLLVCCSLRNWVVITPSRCKRDAQSFVNMLTKAGNGMSFRLDAPQYRDIPDDRQTTYVEALEDVINRTNPEMIMCVVTNNRADRYGAIKRKCCVNRAVPTQVICARNLASKGAMSIATKVAIQLNCKIGGSPWTVEIPLNGLMVVGFDVCHDTSKKGQSYGALVASLDKSCSRYFSAVSPHTNGEELSNELSVNLAKALHKYKEYNSGALPQRIIIYRDGVGDGQVPYVYEHEVEILKQNLASMYGSNPVRMAFIIVNKRINTRFFLNKQNPPPGTVVDDIVTLPERYDFFLVSQSVRQGTVSPTSYNVISDTVGLDPDKLQRLSYKMTHLYYNWSGTVRVPAPCQYAHKLAFLVGQSLHVKPNNQLEDLLYFL